MKRILYILLVFILTTRCSVLPNSYPKETDVVVEILKNKDSIVFPEKYKLLEEASVHIEEAKQRIYNGCFQLSHADIINFINVNKLKVDTRAFGVFQPSGLGLLKKEKRVLIAMPELWKNQGEIYADTVQNKLYISKYYKADT